MPTFGLTPVSVKILLFLKKINTWKPFHFALKLPICASCPTSLWSHALLAVSGSQNEYISGSFFRLYVLHSCNSLRPDRWVRWVCCCPPRLHSMHSLTHSSNRNTGNYSQPKWCNAPCSLWWYSLHVKKKKKKYLLSSLNIYSSKKKTPQAHFLKLHFQGADILYLVQYDWWFEQFPFIRFIICSLLEAVSPCRFNKLEIKMKMTECSFLWTP